MAEIVDTSVMISADEQIEPNGSRMYASILHYRLVGAAAEVRRLLEQAAPLVCQVPGFQAYYVLDCGAERLMSLGVFAERAGAEAYTRLLADRAAERTTAVLVEQTIAGDVLLHAGL